VSSPAGHMHTESLNRLTGDRLSHCRSERMVRELQAVLEGVEDYLETVESLAASLWFEHRRGQERRLVRCWQRGGYFLDARSAPRSIVPAGLPSPLRGANAAGCGRTLDACPRYRRSHHSFGVRFFPARLRTPTPASRPTSTRQQCDDSRARGRNCHGPGRHPTGAPQRGGRP
jgi:hypothetical protein